MRWSPDAPPPDRVRFGLTGVLRAALRLPLLFVTVFGGLVVLLILRLFEAPIFAPKRPLTPQITRAVCRMALLILGIRLHRRGAPMQGQGALVANHASWLDIFVLNACDAVYFVSKAEVARWPGIGWLARATGTVFIARDPREAQAQTLLFQQRLMQGHRLLFFPEGTSTDGRRVLPFKPTLFEAFRADGLRDTLSVQPVSVVYGAPPGHDPRYFGWWGDMDFAGHLLKLAQGPGGMVTVIFHPPHKVSDHADRKALARFCEDAVRQGFEAALTPSP